LARVSLLSPPERLVFLLRAACPPGNAVDESSHSHDATLKSPGTSQKKRQSTVETCARSLLSYLQSSAWSRASAARSSTRPQHPSLRQGLPREVTAFRKPEPTLPSLSLLVRFGHSLHCFSRSVHDPSRALRSTSFA